MLRTLSTAVILSACLVSVGLAQPKKEEFPLAPAVECTPRAGLPNFVAKLARGEGELKVAYLGGSITAQEGWRPKSLRFFQGLTRAKVAQIHAAIGGTGSDLGVFRLRQDVLDRKPDLLFVEFAVNDGGAAPEKIFKCMEGIVRQTWRTLPECDICFVYTLVEGMAPTLQEGRFPRAASAMEKIAEHYGIPSIHMGLEVAKMAKAGTLILKAPMPRTEAEKAALAGKMIFSGDGVHPHPETGHELYLKSIERSWPGIKAASGQAGPHALKAPFVPDNYERAQMIPINKAKLSAGFVLLDPATDKFGKRWAERMTSLHKANKPGETITFKFKGTHAAIYDIVGPDCGQVIVTLDDQKPVVRPRFDAYCVYHRLQTLLIGTDLPDAVHTVKIEVHPDQPDKVKILAQRKETMKNPKDFNDTAFYPGAILVVGELVD